MMKKSPVSYKNKHSRVKSQDHPSVQVQPIIRNFVRSYFSKVVIKLTIDKKKYFQLVFDKNTPLQKVKHHLLTHAKINSLNICFSSEDKDFYFDYLLQENIGFLKDHKRLIYFYTDPSIPDKGMLSSYKLCECLSVGGFSKVYLLRSLRTGEFFAGKFIHKDHSKQKLVQLIANQKEINELVDYPFLAKMHDFIETKDFYVFILDYCCSGQLFNLMKRHRNMSEREAKFYFIQTLLAIEYLHENKIVYRDLKPQNVLLDKKGHVKIADFGLAKFLRDKSYSYCGSLEYMAPQIIEGEGHSFQVDYYCLGALLYQMMIGCPPFYDPQFSVEQTKYYILKNDVKFPERKSLSLEFKDLVRKMLCKEPSHRIGSRHGIREIFAHPWVGKVNRSEYENYNITPPFEPDYERNPFQKDSLPLEDIVIYTKKIEKNICGQTLSSSINIGNLHEIGPAKKKFRSLTKQASSKAHQISPSKTPSNKNIQCYFQKKNNHRQSEDLYTPYNRFTNSRTRADQRRKFMKKTCNEKKIDCKKKFETKSSLGFKKKSVERVKMFRINRQKENNTPDKSSQTE